MKLKKTARLMLLICVCALLSVCLGTGAYAALPNGDPTVAEGVERIDENTFLLYENNAKFNQDGYEYNMDEFFYDGVVNDYEYEIISSVPKNGVIKLDGNILRINPEKQLIDTVTVTATESGGESLQLEFRLKYIDATVFMIKKTYGLLAAVCAVLVLLLLLIFGRPIKGSLRIKVEGEASESFVGGYVRKMPENSAVVGVFRGAGSGYVKYIPQNKVTYIKTEGEMKKFDSTLLIPAREELVLYNNESGINGTSVYFE